MKRHFAWLIVAGAMALPAVASAAGNVNLFLGAKALDEDDWIADEQAEAGVLIDFAPPGWPINLAIDMLASDGDETTYLDVYPYGYTLAKEEVETSELDLGVRKYWDVGSNMRPYFGGGLAFVSLDAKWTFSGLGTVSDDGEGTGIWLNGGIVWAIENFNVGFDVRLTAAQVEMDLGDYEGGGVHGGLLLGFNW